MTKHADLAQMKCEPCEGKTAAFTKKQAQEYLTATPAWRLDIKNNSISRNFLMKNFLSAVKFIHEIADIAETDNHHPDVHLTGYRNLKIELSTHAIGGLSASDFIVAAKINRLQPELKTEKKTHV